MILKDLLFISGENIISIININYYELTKEKKDLNKILKLLKIKDKHIEDINSEDFTLFL